MEITFTAYTREINNQTFYFVKKFITFSEYNEEVQILDNYGMHHNFLKACRIAQIDDEAIINNLLDQLKIIPKAARIIPLHKKTFTHSILRNTQQAILKLRLAGLNS